MVSKIKSIFHPESFWGRWCQWFDMFFKGMEKNTYFEKTPKAKRTPQKRNKLGKKCHPKTRVVFRPLRLRCFLLVGGRLAQKFVSQKFAANRMWNNVSSCQHFCWMVFEARILSTGISQEWCEMNICIFLVINTYFHTGYLGFYNPLPYYIFWDISTRGSNLHRPTDKSLSVEVDPNEKTPSAWRRSRWGWIQKFELKVHSVKWAVTSSPWLVGLHKGWNI